MNVKYLENIERGKDALAAEQANVLVVSERVHLERLTKIILGEPITGTDHKHPGIVEAEARVRACKKYISNNIVALAFSGFYTKEDIVSALKKWDGGRASAERAHTQADISAALANLSTRERVAVVLHYTYSKPVSKIAEHLSTSRYHTNNALEAGITNLCAALNGPILRQIEAAYANWLLQHSLDLTDLYMSVSSSSQDVLTHTWTAEEWATALALPGEQHLLDLVDEYHLEEEAA